MSDEDDYKKVGFAKWSRFKTYLIISVGNETYSIRKNDLDGETLEAPFASIPVCSRAKDVDHKDEKKFVPMKHFILISSVEDLAALEKAGFIKVPDHYFNGYVNVSKPLWKREQNEETD